MDKDDWDLANLVGLDHKQSIVIAGRTRPQKVVKPIAILS
jgi:hypothetical protein